MRRMFAWSLGWLFAGALYLLLIDITDLPELLVGAGAATLAATGMELAREQRVAGETIRTRWLLGRHHPAPAARCGCRAVPSGPLSRRRG